MRFTLALLLSLAAIPTCAQEGLPAPEAKAAPPAEAGEANAFQQQVAYGIGLDLGRRLRADGMKIDLRAIVSGLRDGLTGAEPKMTDEQIAAVMTQFQRQRMSGLAQANQAEGEAFLKENGAKEGVQTTESGLQYLVLEEGDGPSPTAEDTVKCHYEGTFINGEVFDSSYKRGEPTTFPVGGVISGWTEALQMMKVGSTWQVFVPGSIAYGEDGRPGIPPNTTLIFKIELLGIE